MNFERAAALVALAAFLGACSSTAPTRTDTPAAPPAAQKPTSAGATGAAGTANSGAQTVKSRDGSFTGEIIGTPAPNSKFAKLMIGMEPLEVQKVVGRFPDATHSYESGKRWIPFYFGNDARRSQMLFKGEGCLIFTAGGAFSSGGDLIQIQVDPSGACYAP